MNLQTCILFALAIDASPADVDEVLASIRHQFNHADAISPATINPTATPRADVTNIDGPATASTNGIELDVEGLPWDERINASTKAKNEDGTWRLKRGVDKGLVTRTKNTLRKQLDAGAPPRSGVQAAPPGQPPMPGAGIPPPPAPQNTAYTDFVQFITANSRITPEWLKQVLEHYGVQDGAMQNLAHRSDLIPSIEAGIKQALGIA